MTTKVAINGFGRIGRAVFRIILERFDSDIDVVAINDLADDDILAYLLRYDTVMGPLQSKVTIRDGAMTAGGHHVRMLMEPDPLKLPWDDLGVDVVVESTGVFRDRASLTKHLAAGAKRVLLTVPARDEIDATIVLGVNHHELDAEDRIVSNASCTTNCLAPLAKILDDEFGVRRGLMTTVHAYTNDQRLADVPHKDLGAAKAVGKVLPNLAGKLDGMAMRVPVPDGSTVDLLVEVDRETTPEEVKAAVRAAARDGLDGIVEYSEEPLVSTDIIGNPHSSIFDAEATRVSDGRWIKVMSWYDNEWGYSNRVVDLIELMGDLPNPK